MTADKLLRFFALFVVCWASSLSITTSEEVPGSGVVIDLHKPFNLSCNITTEGETEDNLKFEWFKDNEPLNYSNTNIVYSNNVLHIKYATELDCGEYMCKANTSDTNASRTIQVQSKPLIHPKLPKSMNKIEGETLTMHCVAFGVPKPTIMWFKNGTAVSDLSNTRLSFKSIPGDHANETKSELKITDLENNDRANYSCFANSTTGSAHSDTLVRVKDKLAALWPFLGIVAEVVVLCTIIFIYEKRRSKQEFDESDTDQSPDTKNVTENKDVRQRK